MENYTLKKVLKIKNEITDLLNDIDKKENQLIEQFNKNIDNLSLYRSYLEEIIEEYHLICKKIYK